MFDVWKWEWKRWSTIGVVFRMEWNIQGQLRYNVPYGVEHTGTVAIQCSVWSGTYRDSCDTMFRMEWNIQGQLRYNVLLYFLCIFSPLYSNA